MIPQATILQATILHWAEVIAGLGLFFAGMELLSGNLRSLTSRRFQRAVASWTKRPGQGFLWGLLAGAVTQSSAVVTFVVVGLLMAGNLTVRRGLPILLGCNLGVGALLFVVSLEVGTAVLLLVGLVGIGVTLDRLQRWRTLLWALFGVALLFVGLDFVRSGSAPLAETGLLRDALAATADSALLAFLIGAALSVAVHSSLAVAVLAMSLAAAGLFGFETAVMVIYATNFGSGLRILFLSWRLRGEARQLAMFQVAAKVAGCLVFLPLFFLERATDWPLALALIEWLSPDADQRIAWAFLLFNGGVALLLLPLLAPAARLLARVWPRTAAEEAARPAFLGDYALDDPELALDLAAREQHRLYLTILGLLDPLVEERQPAPGPGPDGRAARELLRVTQGFLDDLGRQAMTPRQYERYYARLDAQGHLEGLLADVGRFAEVLARLEASAGGRRLGHLLGHSLHAVMHACAEALTPEAGPEEVAQARALTADRGPVLRSVREGYLGDSARAEEPTLAGAMLTGFSLFERLLLRLGALLARRAGPGETRSGHGLSRTREEAAEGIPCLPSLLAEFTKERS
ncbi:MAG: Na/Pi symporter [Tistlia sp.]|uniref:Na/Pi cotransporter family protein n=1 Tax=Tistlia sp. TaxID=3057121 RepID=UPI0034A1577C